MFKLTNDSLSPTAQATVICVVAYEDVPEGANIPNGHRWFQTYLDWLSVPNTPESFETAQEISDRQRAERIQELKNEGLVRINGVMPAIATFDTVELVREMWLSIAPAARSATTTLQNVIDIYQEAKNGITFLNTATDSEIASYDVTNTPNWPIV